MSQRSHQTKRAKQRIPISDLAQGLTTAWQKGWHPQDVARTMPKDDSIGRAIFADALRLNRLDWHDEAGPLWFAQADSLGAISPWWNQESSYWPQFRHRHGANQKQMFESRMASASSFLVMICDMGEVQPAFEALPTQPGWNRGTTSGGEDRVLAKVRALLSKAESTEYEAEAEALSAKAQEWIARYSIDIALLAEQTDVPGGHKLYLSDPYAKAKFTLLAAIASANNCRCVWHQSRKTATLIGHQSDLRLVEVLFTSLLLQGTGAVLGSGAKTNHQGKSTTRSWRNAFWYGFASRIGERLTSAAAVVRDSHSRHMDQDFLPVLSRRSETVDLAFAEAFPNLGTMRASLSNTDGMNAGHRFADSAQLDVNRNLGNASRNGRIPIGPS